MKENIKVAFGLRIDRVILIKLRCIAGYNMCSVNMEITHIIKQHIAQFEEKTGEIGIENWGR